MKEIYVDNDFEGYSGNGFATFYKKGYKSKVTGVLPDSVEYYSQDLIIRYNSKIGIARQGRGKTSISKVKENRRLLKLDIMCSKFDWIEDEEELAKEII